MTLEQFTMRIKDKVEAQEFFIDCAIILYAQDSIDAHKKAEIPLPETWQDWQNVYDGWKIAKARYAKGVN